MEPSQAANIRYGNHGETICTDATWTTLVSFILLNYVMHAFTVMPAPGAGSGRKSFWVILCLFIPTLGVFAAFKRIGSGLAFLQSRLENASRNEALCMIVGIGEDGICVVPTAFAEAKISKKELYVLIPSRAVVISQTNTYRTSLFRDSARVHGCHPAMQAAPVHFRDSAQQPVRFHDRIFDYFHSLFQHRPENTGEVEYRIILVRHGLPIHPLWDGVDYRDMEIARSYSFVRGISAIAQIFFAIKALYGARGDQIDRYGYAAFGVTVIPYLWMSVLNLIAAIMQPQYPYMYLLHYRNAECLCTNVPIPIPKDEEKGKEPAVEMRELDTPKPDVQERDTGQEKARRKNAELDQALQDKVLGAVGVVHASPKDLIDRVRCDLRREYVC